MAKYKQLNISSLRFFTTTGRKMFASIINWEVALKFLKTSRRPSLLDLSSSKQVENLVRRSQIGKMQSKFIFFTTSNFNELVYAAAL